MPVSVSILVYAADVHQGARQIPRWRWRQLQECQWDKGCMAMPPPPNNMSPAQPRGQPSLGFPRAPSVVHPRRCTGLVLFVPRTGM